MGMTILLSGCASTGTLAQELSSSPTPVGLIVSPTVAPTATLAPSATSLPTTTPLPTQTSEPTERVESSATPSPEAPTPVSVAQREQLFNEVWTIINSHYLYPDFRGHDWNAIHDEYQIQIQQAESNEAFYSLLTDMVAQLDDRHSRFLAPSAATFEDAFSTGRESYVGIGVMLVPRTDGSFIQEVFPGGPAALAGLQPRDRIIAINGAPFDGGSDLYGPEGSEVRLTVVRSGQQPHEVLLKRRAVQGRVVPAVRRLENDIGYLKIPTLWVNDMDAQVSGALTDMVAERQINGLILDLRGNPGGWNYVLTGVLGHFVRGQVGMFFDQRGTKPLIIGENAGPDLRGTPLAVLVDDATTSYAEVIAGVLQQVAGAHVVGVPTAGNTETIYAYELVGGARLWVAQEGFKLLNGENLEGHGVQPDTVVQVDWTRYSEDDDPQIKEALRWLNQQQTK